MYIRIGHVMMSAGHEGYDRSEVRLRQCESSSSSLLGHNQS